MSMTPPICSVDACGGESDAKGLCRYHYSRQRRHGSEYAPLTGPIDESEWTTVAVCRTEGCLWRTVTWGDGHVERARAQLSAHTYIHQKERTQKKTST